MMTKAKWRADRTAATAMKKTNVEIGDHVVTSLNGMGEGVIINVMPDDLFLMRAEDGRLKEINRSDIFYVPQPDEIAAAARRIQETWTPKVRWDRTVKAYRAYPVDLRV